MHFTAKFDRYLKHFPQVCKTRADSSASHTQWLTLILEESSEVQQQQQWAELTNWLNVKGGAGKVDNFVRKEIQLTKMANAHHQYFPWLQQWKRPRRSFPNNKASNRFGWAKWCWRPKIKAPLQALKKHCPLHSLINDYDKLDYIRARERRGILFESHFNTEIKPSLFSNVAAESK